MPLPVTNRPLAEHRKRFPEALRRVYELVDVEKWGNSDDRPGTKPEHVFDFAEGLRLIISRERTEKGKLLVHLSASLTEGSLFDRLAAMPKPQAMHEFKWAVQRYYFELCGRTIGDDEFLGWSEGKGVPHWVIPEVS